MKRRRNATTDISRTTSIRQYKKHTDRVTGKPGGSFYGKELKKALRRRKKVAKAAANPLPSNWTSGKVRVNKSGEVQVMLTGKAAKRAASKIRGMKNPNLNPARYEWRWYDGYDFDARTKQDAMRQAKSAWRGAHYGRTPKMQAEKLAAGRYRVYVRIKQM